MLIGGGAGRVLVLVLVLVGWVSVSFGSFSLRKLMTPYKVQSTIKSLRVAVVPSKPARSSGGGGCAVLLVFVHRASAWICIVYLRIP